MSSGTSDKITFKAYSLQSGKAKTVTVEPGRGVPVLFSRHKVDFHGFIRAEGLIPRRLRRGGVDCIFFVIKI